MKVRVAEPAVGTTVPLRGKEFATLRPDARSAAIGDNRPSKNREVKRLECRETKRDISDSF